MEERRLSLLVLTVGQLELLTSLFYAYTCIVFGLSICPLKLNLAITSESLVIGVSYFTYVFLGTIPFF